MKRCPNCQRLFGEDMLFCLDDGTPLEADLSSDPTVVIPRASANTLPPAAAPVQRSGGTNILLFGLILILSVAAVGFGVAYFFTASRQGNESATISNNSDPNQNGRQPERKSGNSTATETNTISVAKDDQAATEPKSRPVASTQRLRFAKDAVSTSVNGTLGPAGTRHYILACGAGQRLTARLSSSSGCITFAQGSTEFSSLTTLGDNRVSVRNQCKASEAFGLEISVL